MGFYVLALYAPAYGVTGTFGRSRESLDGALEIGRDEAAKRAVCLRSVVIDR
jgi:hypothetical protein